MFFDKLKSGLLSLDDTFTVSENAWRKGGAASGGSTMFLKIGEEIDFWYDPDDPYNVTAGKATLKGLNMIFSGFIIVFGAFTIIMIRKVIFYIRKRNEYF